MALRRFHDADAFYAHVAPFLMAKEAENNLLFGLIHNIRAGEYADPYLACVESEGRIVLVTLRTPPYGLIVSRAQDPDALAPLVDDLRRLYGTLPGVNGPAETSDRFAELWRAAAGQPARLSMAERSYQLRRVIPVQGVPGFLRAITEADRELVYAWMCAFQMDAFGHPDERIKMALERYYASSPEQRALWLWEVDGQAVSMAGYSGPTPHGMRIGPVYTPPEVRRLGYASACTAAVSQRILDLGKTLCFLFTDLANPTSNHIYQTIGFEPICDVNQYTFEAPGGDA